MKTPRSTPSHAAKTNQAAATRSDTDRRLRQHGRLARQLRLLELIQGRKSPDAKSLAEALEVQPRTIYRDLNILDLAGVPYYYDKAAKGYRVRSNYHFPILQLSDEELLDQAAATALAGAHGHNAAGARATTRKLQETVSDERARLLADAQQLVAVLHLKVADHSQHQSAIRTIQRALVERKQLLGRYASPYRQRDSNARELHLHPYRLCFAGQAWYLIARAAVENAPKTYRIARFQSVKSTSREAEVPHDFDLEAYFDNAWSVYRGRESYDIEIEFTADAAGLVTETRWHHTQQVERSSSDGSVVLTFTVDGLEEIVWWVLGWSGRARVLQPPALRSRVVEQLEKAVEMHRKGA